METNYEHYKAIIDPVWEGLDGLGYSVTDNKPGSCMEVSCEDCLFNKKDGNCNIAERRWLVSTYIDPTEDTDWSNVPMDTPVLYRDDLTENWYKGYFAKYEDG